MAEIEKTCGAMRASYSSRAIDFGAVRINGMNRPGLGRDVIHLGNNSGYQAVNLAFLLGAKWIGLLGFDMQATGGQSHWHGDHPEKCRASQPNFQHWIKCFDQLAVDLKEEGVKVVNYTQETALKCFERCHL